MSNRVTAKQSKDLLGEAHHKLIEVNLRLTGIAEIVAGYNHETPTPAAIHGVGDVLKDFSKQINVIINQMDEASLGLTNKTN